MSHTTISDADNGNGTDPSADTVVTGELMQRGARVAAQLVRHQQQGLAAAPQVTARELAERLEVIREATRIAMKQDTDYGVVPGTDKPGLFKPGAEKLAVLFQLDVQPVNELIWGPGEHLTVISRATVYHAPNGIRLGYGEGICSSREKKYAKRRAELICPGCGAANIRKSRQEGEGYYCWRKTGGCGATFAEGDQRIAAQSAGEIENPDLPDTWNTIDKMAKKRAYVDAVLSVTGASEIFTQDIGAEDTPPQDSEPAYGPLVAEELKPLAIRAAISLCGGEADTAQVLWQQIETALDGYMPHAAAIALLHAARQLSARHVQAAAANRGLTQAQLVNLLRAAAGAAPLDPPRAQAQLPALLERITDPIARKTLELIATCTTEAAVPGNGTTTPNATPTGNAEPSPTAPPAVQDIHAAQQRQHATITGDQQAVSIDFGAYGPDDGPPFAA
jgi:hypothetical protein